jgi:deoxyribose-phosphate aldolase
MTASRDDLVEAVTREVLAALEGPAHPPNQACRDCVGSCAAHCSDKVRGFVGSAGAERISYQGEGANVPTDLAPFIDHTLLKPDATAADVDKLCAEARELGFAAVCVNPVWVKRCVQELRGTDVAVASVVGFPFGATTADVKAYETRRVLREGAREIDMVINVGALRSGDLDTVRDEIRKVSDACHEVGAKNKVIIETALLTDEEKVIASHLAREAKADYVKTSTGYGPHGATVQDVLLMRETVGPRLGVKAAGGIRNAQDVRDLIAAGATRIGASASVGIVGGKSGGGS